MSTRISSARRTDIRKLTTMGMLTAIGVLLAFFEIPLIPVAPFLLYDPADVPILIGTLVYGPVAGVIMTLAVSFFQTLLHGSGGVIGFVMHVVATGAMACVVGLLYSKSRKSFASAAMALLVGVFTMTAVMTGANIILTPIYMGVDRSVVLQMLLPAIIPFNLLKAGINSIIAFIVYRGVEKLATR